VLNQSASPAVAIPAPLTEFIGRDRELAAVSTLLAESRLLTLTGAGGSGKTRLAIEAARLAAQRDSDLDVAWVELQSVDDPAGVALHIAMLLGVRAEGGGSAVQAMQAVLAERRVLLVLDNCEHVVDACASLVERLLGAVPSLRVLTTSREALSVAGERSWLVPTLSLPPLHAATAADVLASGAGRLFVDRARDVKPEFAASDANAEAIAGIVHRLDGLPLAIELAAARSALLTPAQLAERLHDRFALLTAGSRTAPPRQRTLRAAVDWSYELLEPEERLLLERFAVFVGGFSLDAAEQVVAFGGLRSARVLELLASLAAKSLVAMTDEGGVPRYRLLETIREYASEQRQSRPAEPDLAERHAQFYERFLRERRDEVVLARAARLQEVDLEHGNVLAALAWSAAERRGDDVGLPMIWSLQWYWYHRQLWREGLAQSELALRSAVTPTDAHRGAALHGMGVFGLHVLHPQADEWLAQAEHAWIAAGEARWLSFTLLVRVVSASVRGDVDAAEGFAKRMLEIAERQPDPWDAALAKAHGMVPVLNWRGEWARSLALLNEAIAAFRARDYHTGVSYALDAQAFVALRLGELKRASSLAVQSLRNEWDRENRWLAGRNLRILAAVAEQEGDFSRAATLFGITEVWYEAVGASALSGERAVVNELPQRLRARMSAEDYEAAVAVGRPMTCMQAMRYALSVADAPAGAEVTATSVAADDSSSSLSATAPTLSVHALGRLRIARRGEELGDEAWPYAKPRELLLFLLSHPEGRTREQIGLAFWPDVSAAQVKNNFHVTLHHLRRTLGDGGWVRYEKGRYAVASELVEFDVNQFVEEAERGLRLLRADPEDASVLVALQRAVERYAGPFLDEADVGDWHIDVRDRLARLFEDALLTLSEALGVEGRQAESADLLRRLLALDPAHEEAARLLMLSLARDDRRAEALRVFERLSETLQDQVGALPGSELRKLANAIRAGDAV
jgi:predicted ATPase/DNA-binding SARP family transcriptional activator